MYKVIKLRRGLNIRIKGKADKVGIKATQSETYSVKPIDFFGITPKPAVAVNDFVKAGTCLFFDKKQPEIQFCSPVSGVVTAINRGEKRSLQEIIVKADHDIQYQQFSILDLHTANRESIIKLMLDSGVWPYLHSRPFNIIANPNLTPRDIFISGFDTAPLGPDVDFCLRGLEKEFQYGINALRKLTKGKVHLSIDISYPAAKAITEAKGIELHHFSGPHPTGNVGVQIHHIAPINKGDVVWTIAPQEVVMLGKLFLKGIYDASKTIALCGSEVKIAKYFKIINGANIANLIHENIKKGELRYISGNALTGSNISANGHLGFFDNQITILPEGHHSRFIGWALPGFDRFSLSRSYFSWLNPGGEYHLDTNLNGGRRAYVMTGEYEKVLPMDILPVQLIKSILAEDIEMMENLGIYELVEEDLALCEFVCTSKTDVQQILRRGIDMMITEMT